MLHSSEISGENAILSVVDSSCYNKVVLPTAHNKCKRVLQGDKSLFAEKMFHMLRPFRTSVTSALQIFFVIVARNKFFCFLFLLILVPASKLWIVLLHLSSWCQRCSGVQSMASSASTSISNLCCQVFSSFGSRLSSIHHHLIRARCFDLWFRMLFDQNINVPVSAY